LALFLLFRRRRKQQQQRLRNAFSHKRMAADEAVEAPSDSAPETLPATVKAYLSELSTVGYHQELPANEKVGMSPRDAARGFWGS
jgi:hypothetical protein